MELHIAAGHAELGEVGLGKALVMPYQMLREGNILDHGSACPEPQL